MTKLANAFTLLLRLAVRLFLFLFLFLATADGVEDGIGGAECGGEGGSGLADVLVPGEVRDSAPVDLLLFFFLEREKDFGVFFLNHFGDFMYESMQMWFGVRSRRGFF
jgi:hypothetical protein